MVEESEQLRIIAEPKAVYRARYESEQGTDGNRIKRYIRAERTNQFQLEHRVANCKLVSTFISVRLKGEVKTFKYFNSLGKNHQNFDA